jgi:SMODS and SLOG-associating 2TM effector domain family 5
MTAYNPENKIYLTYKTRMSAEAKLRQTGRWLNNLMSWYSFCLIVISLSQITNTYQVYKADFIFTACSIGLFGLSLFVYGERYFEKADQFRNCYLEMQAIFESSLTTNAKMKKYAEIRNKYENQRDDDYDDMLFDAWMRNQNLENASGPVKITWQRSIIVLARRVVRYGIFVSLFLFPVAALILSITIDQEAAISTKTTAAVIINEG